MCLGLSDARSPFSPPGSYLRIKYRIGGGGDGGAGEKNRRGGGWSKKGAGGGVEGGVDMDLGGWGGIRLFGKSVSAKRGRSEGESSRLLFTMLNTLKRCDCGLFSISDTRFMWCWMLQIIRPTACMDNLRKDDIHKTITLHVT